MENDFFVALIQFVPLIVICLVLVAFALPMAQRKGLGIGLALLCVIPFLGPLLLVWIASKPDKDILDRLARLEKSSGDVSQS